MEAVALPAVLDGMLRPGTWVRRVDGLRDCGVVTDIVEPRGIVTVYWMQTERLERVDRSEIEIDLSDATARTHVTWWLGQRMRPDVSLITGWTFYNTAIFWILDHPRVGGRQIAWAGRTGWLAEYVPALREIEEYDSTRRFPDGSRVVDAVSMRIIAQHYFPVAHSRPTCDDPDAR